jgi:hypothetical protein
MQKKEYTLGGGGEALWGGALEPGAAEETLGLLLLPTGRPGRRFVEADNEAATAGTEDLFLLPQERPRPRFSTGAPIFRRDPFASAMETKVGKEKP